MRQHSGSHLLSDPRDGATLMRSFAKPTEHPVGEASNEAAPRDEGAWP